MPIAKKILLAPVLIVAWVLLVALGVTGDQIRATLSRLY
jgi:hypothetical protein